MNYKNAKQSVHHWKPGATPYKDYLAKLSPEERSEHLKKRAARKAMKKVMKQVTDEYQEQWVAELHNAAWILLQKAKFNEDPVAFATVWDRIVGKPRVDEDALVDPDRPLPFRDEELE